MRRYASAWREWRRGTVSQPSRFTFVFPVRLLNQFRMPANVYFSVLDNNGMVNNLVEVQP